MNSKKESSFNQKILEDKKTSKSQIWTKINNIGLRYNFHL